MPLARGDFLMFVDDDDLFIPGAIAKVREIIAGAPGAMHAFRIVGADLRNKDGSWIRSGAATAIPNIPERLGVWDDGHCDTEWHFVATTLKHYSDNLILHDIPIYLIRPLTDLVGAVVAAPYLYGDSDALR